MRAFLSATIPPDHHLRRVLLGLPIRHRQPVGLRRIVAEGIVRRVPAVSPQPHVPGRNVAPPCFDAQTRVAPGNKPGMHMTDIDGAWESIRARAGLHDVRIHDIRHSCATTSFFEEISSASRRNVSLLSHCYSLSFSIISKLGQPRLIFSRQFA